MESTVLVGLALQQVSDLVWRLEVDWH